MKYLLQIILVLLTLSVFSQKTITLEECIQHSIQQHPLSQQLNLLDEVHQLTDENLKKTYYPQLYLNGQATYQSDVVELPDIPIPGVEFGTLSNDQYKLTLDANQIIYNGGKTKNLRTLEELKSDENKKELEIQLYKIKEQVVSTYFNILMIQKKMSLLDTYKKHLTLKLDEINTLTEYGVLLPSQGQVIQAEIIKIDQNILESDISLNTTIKVLEVLTKDTLNNLINYREPSEPTLNSIPQNLREEEELFSIQQNKIKQLKNIKSEKRLPFINLFGQAGYGKPGYNMLNDQFNDFYMVGTKISWKIWDWNQVKKEKSILDIQADIIEKQRETFQQQQDIKNQQQIAEIEKYQKLIGMDQAILDLKKEIAETTSKQLENGSITTSQYLIEVNAENQARLDMEIHKILLLKSKYTYQLVQGIL